MDTKQLQDDFQEVIDYWRVNIGDDNVRLSGALADIVETAAKCDGNNRLQSAVPVTQRQVG